MLDNGPILLKKFFFIRVNIIIRSKKLRNLNYAMICNNLVETVSIKQQKERGPNLWSRNVTRLGVRTIVAKARMPSRHESRMELSAAVWFTSPDIIPSLLYKMSEGTYFQT